MMSGLTVSCARFDSSVGGELTTNAAVMLPKVAGEVGAAGGATIVVELRGGWQGPWSPSTKENHCIYNIIC